MNLSHSRSLNCLPVAVALVSAGLPAAAGAITVPGTSNPYLAGMADGTLSQAGDAAPAQSPVAVPGLCLRIGSGLSFSASGGVSNDPNLMSYPLVGPDGGTTLTIHANGPENGISDILAPYSSLVGVFLGASPPNLVTAPPRLDFSTAASRNYLTLSPTLQQTFFIGNGLTSLGAVQHVQVPSGATRLYLGVLDVAQWYNNPGSFEVSVFDPCPTPVAATDWGRIKGLFRAP